jgi:hypothetical protein
MWSRGGGASVTWPDQLGRSAKGFSPGRPDQLCHLAAISGPTWTFGEWRRPQTPPQADVTGSTHSMRQGST